MRHSERANRRRKMAAEVKRTHDPEAVAVKYGVSTAWVLVACREHRVKMPVTVSKARMSTPRPHSQSTYMALKVIVDLQAGKQPLLIAKKHGVTKQRVSQIKKQAQKVGLLK